MYPILVMSLGLSLFHIGCSRQTATMGEVTSENRPDYSRELPPGQSALRLITDPRRYPDLGRAFRNRDIFVQDAIDRSLGWFEKPSSRKFYPFKQFTHEQAYASLLAMQELMTTATDEQSFISTIIQKFDVYESVGWDGSGTVLYTGYYAPIFNASPVRTSRFTAPLYKRPADLETEPLSGTPLGRKLPGGGVVPYYTRKEIEQSGMFAGNELVWLEDSLQAYIVQVNGSAKLHMPDGTSMYIGYAGKTDRPYKGLGQSMLDKGYMTKDGLSLKAIRAAFDRDPKTVESLILLNENYVFFTEYEGDFWPAGSLGVKVSQETSLATDKKIYPRGGLVMVDTQAVTYSQGKRPFVRFMLDQDTGGAIKAPGRADIFMGIGKSAEILAGGQYAEGRLYYFFLKPQYVQEYLSGQGG
jgi:membrane-bound lytic murein transglycosylase A